MRLSRAWLPLSVCALLAGNAEADETRKADRPPAGLELLAVGSLGTSTWTPELAVDPYGGGIGFDGGYVFGFGFRIGAYVSYGLGRTITQDYSGLIGDPGVVTTSASSFDFGASVAYDMPLWGLLLRYSLGLGPTWMWWSVDPRVRRFDYFRNDPQVGFHLVPGATLLWPIGRFEAGVGMRYFIQVADTIPQGIVGDLVMGVRL